jgi:hypothetical protein
MAKTWKAALATMVGALVFAFVFHKMDPDMPRDLWCLTIILGSITGYFIREGLGALIALPRTRWKQYFAAFTSVMSAASQILLLVLGVLYCVLRAHSASGQIMAPSKVLIPCAYISLGGLAYLAFAILPFVSLNFTQKDAEDCAKINLWLIFFRTIPRFLYRKGKAAIAGFRDA